MIVQGIMLEAASQLSSFVDIKFLSPGQTETRQLDVPNAG
jgi:hypothetical protein